jgi:hypothetical protein
MEVREAPEASADDDEAPEQYEIPVQELACDLDRYGMLMKWSRKNMPAKDRLVWEFSPKQNADPSANNPGWGTYVGKIETLGLDLGVRCGDDNELVTLDRGKPLFFFNQPAHLFPLLPWLQIRSVARLRKGTSFEEYMRGHLCGS